MVKFLYIVSLLASLVVFGVGVDFYLGGSIWGGLIFTGAGGFLFGKYGKEFIRVLNEKG